MRRETVKSRPEADTNGQAHRQQLGGLQSQMTQSVTGVRLGKGRTAVLGARGTMYDV
jgi:hypothetical protein